MKNNDRLFESAALKILLLKEPKVFREGFKTDQNFESVYAFAVGVAVGMAGVDDRLSGCILKKHGNSFSGGVLDNYEGLTDEQKVTAFYSYFLDRVRYELSTYHCKNTRLLKAVGI